MKREEILNIFKMLIEDQELDMILKRDFTSRYRKGYVNAEGVTMPEQYLEIKDGIDNWNVKEEDVWICSFPKSGNRQFIPFRKHTCINMFIL